VDAPWIEPKLETEAPKAEAPRIEPRIEAEAPRADASRETGKMMIVPPLLGKSWDRATIDQGPAAADGAQASGRFGKRRLAAIAAVAVLAAITGAIGVSLATSGRGHGVASEQSSEMASHTQALEATIKRLESEVATLKTSIDRSAKGDAGQFAKVNDRLDKVEKAHSESTAKLTRLNETLDRQHVAVAPVASPTTSATNVTGSIPTAAAAPVPLPAPKPATARLPAVDGWVLRDITNGGALIEGRGGLYEVYAGDPVPGLGRVDAIRKQDGRWVVVTSKGLVVSR
jgi:outer membrane murein-binding lipoprotein Lpp